MKKQYLVKLAMIAMLALTSCGGNSSNTSSSVEDSSVVSSSVEEYPAVTLSFSAESYDIERGEELTIRVKIASTDSTAKKTVNFTLEQEGEGDYISIDENKASNNPGSITVSGKYIGSAYLVATSVANPTVSAKVKVNCIKRVPALKSVWQKVVANDNYTFTTTRTPTTDEMEEDEELTEDSQIPYTRIIATENSIFQEAYDTETKEWGAMYSTYNSDYSAVTGSSWGYALDTQGNAFTVTTDTNGNLNTDVTIAQNNSGLLLDKTTFKGLGESATGPSDVGTFFGLEAINPSWLPSSKVSNNVYEIEGTDSDYYSCYVEYLLWNLMDPAGFETFYYNNYYNIESYTDITDAIDTVITAVDSTTISVELTVKESATESGDAITYTGTMSDITTTENPEITGLDNLLKTAVASYPALSDEMEAFKTSCEDNNYVYSFETYFDDAYSVSASYYIYYSEKYVMMYYPADYIALYNSVATTPIEQTQGFGFGVLQAADGLHEFEFTPAVTDDDGNVTTEQNFTVDDVIDGTDASTELVTTDLMNLEGLPNYIAQSKIFTDNVLYILSTDAEEIFSGYPAYYYCQSYKMSNAIYNWMYGQDMGGENSYYFVSGISIDTNKDGSINEVSFLNAYSQDGYSYGLYFTPELSNFGTADDVCPAYAAIAEYLAA